MRFDAFGHLSDDELAGAVENAAADGSRAYRHLQICAACRRRRAELVDVRALLRSVRSFEETPRRDSVPGALKRLRLRRHAVTNLNEFFDSVYALVRGFASLLAVGESAESHKPSAYPTEDNPRG